MLDMRNRIAELRAERELTQQDLADALGVSRQTVNSIEKNRWDPSLPLAFDIAHHFGLTIEEVFHADRSNGAAQRRQLDTQPPR